MPLRQALCNNDVYTAVLLLNYGADPNAGYQDNDTPFINAVKQGNKVFVALLLEAGADVTIKDEYGRAISFYLYPSLQVDDWESLRLHTAAYTDDVNLFYTLFYLSVNLRRYTKSALIWAARFGYTDIVSGLLGASLDINAKDWKNKTALMWAVQGSHLNVVKELLSGGASICAKDNYGKDVLDWAKQKPNELKMQCNDIKKLHGHYTNKLKCISDDIDMSYRKLFTPTENCYISELLNLQSQQSETSQRLSKINSEIHNVECQLLAATHILILLIECQRRGIEPKSTHIPASMACTTPKLPEAPKPFILNMDSVQRKITETARVQELLQTQFQEEDAPVAPAPPLVSHIVVTADSPPMKFALAANPFHNLDNKHFVLLNMLLQKPVWRLQEIAAIAAPLDLLASGAIERFNDMAYEFYDEPIFEGDDPIEVNIALAKSILASTSSR